MPVAAKKTTAPVIEGPNFMDDSFYSQGGGLPEGNYVFADMDIRMFMGFGDNPKGPERLGVMLTLKNLDDLAAEPRNQFYSMGSSAHKSFQPNPQTGTSLVTVPGGSASTLNNSTNWALFRQSLIDSGLPPGICSNDISPLIGTHVHMQNVPEPAERASFQSSTGDVQQDRKAGQVAIVTEILEEGKPWEGSGGVPTEAPTKGKAAVKPAAKPVAAAKGKAVPATVEPEPGEDEAGIMEAAAAGLAEFLGANENGGMKLTVKMAAQKFVKANYEKDVAEAVISSVYGDDEKLGEVLGTLGFALNGAKISPAA